MSNMAATVSSLALISVGPKMTAILEGVIRFSSLWLHTLWMDRVRNMTHKEKVLGIGTVHYDVQYENIRGQVFDKHLQHLPILIW